MTSVYEEEVRVYNGGEFPCYYDGSEKHPRLRHITHAHLIHAILWPTLLFVLGFVGLFLSCIMLQYDRADSSSREQLPLNYTVMLPDTVKESADEVEVVTSHSPAAVEKTLSHCTLIDNHQHSLERNLPRYVLRQEVSRSVEDRSDIEL